MGPQASKSYPGQQLVRAAGPKPERARQEIDYGRRGIAGYVFGALQPATGEAFTLTFERRTTVNWVDFLSAIETWIDPAVERVYAVLDNLNTHSAPDVLLFSLLHPRWEFVFQPKYAAYLNLIEPWWKVLRSLALKGVALKARSKSRMPSHVPRPTGMIIGIRSSGAAGAAIVSRSVSALQPSQISH